MILTGVQKNGIILSLVNRNHNYKLRRGVKIMLFFQLVRPSDDFITVPNELVLADTSTKRIVKSISFIGAVIEICYKKVRRLYPYGNSFSTDSASIIELNEPIYHFGKKFYKYTNDNFKEIKGFEGKIKEKKELEVQKGCKYRIFEIQTNSEMIYMVEPK